MHVAFEAVANDRLVEHFKLPERLPLARRRALQEAHAVRHLPPALFAAHPHNLLLNDVTRLQAPARHGLLRCFSWRLQRALPLRLCSQGWNLARGKAGLKQVSSRASFSPPQLHPHVAPARRIQRESARFAPSPTERARCPQLQTCLPPPCLAACRDPGLFPGPDVPALIQSFDRDLHSFRQSGPRDHCLP